jgi:sec-independent protein translocase protein TatC
MDRTQLIVIGSVIGVLVLFPLIVMVLVRVLIPLKTADGPEEEEFVEAPLEFGSLRDFWESNVPHLTELRDRLIKCAVAVTVATGLGFAAVNSSFPFGEPLPLAIARHLDVDKLQGIELGEVFFSYFRIALVFGIAISIPFILYQIIAFLAPALHPSEKRVLFMALPFVFELFLAGLAFGWFFTVPSAVTFLRTYGTSDLIVSELRVDSFFSVVATLTLWNGIVFELPVIVYLLARIGLVTAQTLANTRRYAIVIILIVAALITPTGDPFNLMLMAVPMYLLYEFGIILARFVPRPREEQVMTAGNS